MALSLNSLEPVNFKGRECMPKINAELRLRLTSLKNYNNETDKILASAFPDDEGFVLNFLENAPVIEKQILHAYLIGGEKAAEATMTSLQKSLENSITDAFQKGVEK